MTRSTNTRFAVAVHVLTYLAGLKDGRPATSAQLSQSANVNAVYIRQVLGPLRSAGLVRSHPGRHGGWEMALDPSDITLDQVWSLLQGEDPVLGLHGPDPTCTTGRSVQQSLIALDREVAAAILAALRHNTVQELLADVRGTENATAQPDRRRAPR
ncbi:Rrf2 family transcriptional regulator [Actinomadura graeca]|uniref:Rrf2 family transcriptional regulator n=1 Tax=Actinomadura graeca TaxID=2750812 RepID=A0ABX8QX62_9ACTN|nr:Rrf2 family transcriptional regulator [Actinomadura graeca]QXJ23440.1 Rrf2 family transcriptional regulator [Actinomadura graeca]